MQVFVLNVSRPQARRFTRVIPEIDIWRAATLMLKRYGEKALEQSATRADELAADGDHDGALTWRRITRRRRAARQHHAERTGPLIGTHPKRSRRLPPSLFLKTDFIENGRLRPAPATRFARHQCR